MSATAELALARLRHLYANLVNGGVRDAAKAGSVATGLLAPAIEALERATTSTAHPAEGVPVSVGDKQLIVMVDAAMAEMSGIHPPLRRSECQRLILAALAATPAAPAGAVEPAPLTFMTEDRACEWSWDKVREEVGTNGWTTGDSCNFYGFYLWGWNYRGQYELQRAATRAAVMQELATAPTADEPVVLPEPDATTTGMDEFGPCFGWLKHWANYPVGTNFYAEKTVRALLAQATAAPAAVAVPITTTRSHADILESNESDAHKAWAAFERLQSDARDVGDQTLNRVLREFLMRSAQVGIFGPKTVPPGTAPAAVAGPSDDGISREQWIEQAMLVYLIAGETEEVARECAKALCGEQNWDPVQDDLGDPYEEAMSDVEGRGPSPVAQGGAHTIIDDLIAHIERTTCTHDDTHRGGVIWEICDGCGAKWADDQGGKPEFKWAAVVERARQFIDAARAQAAGKGVE